MQRNPELAPRLSVRKRDGRDVAFDEARLVHSVAVALAATGRDDPALAEQLAVVVTGCLRRRAGEGPLPAAEIADLVREVLAGADCADAAAAHRCVQEQRAVRRQALRIRRAPSPDAVRLIPPAGGSASVAGEDPEAWSKGRVLALLAAHDDLPVGLAEDIAAEVEAGLFASGLASVSAALLREWVDNALALRGHAPRVGRHQFVGLLPHELREVLSSGATGHAAEMEVSVRLLSRYALAEVFPGAVAAAYAAGLIGLENLGSGGRLDTLTVPPWGLPLLGACGTRRDRLRALGPVLRNLSQLVSREVLLPWDGPALAREPAADLLCHLAEPPLGQPAAARLVLCLPALRQGLAAPFLGALEDCRSRRAGRAARLPVLRLAAARLPEDVLLAAARLESVDDRVQFSARAPEPGLVSASVAVNVARLALAAGPRKVREFLDGLGAAVELAVGALAAQSALAGGGSQPLAALREGTGLPPGALAGRRRLALCGVPEAAVALLGSGPRGRGNRLDLAAAIGERVQSVLERGAGGEGELFVGAASPRTADRFGRLDLSAFAGSRDLLPLAAHREGYRYDGAQVLPPGTDPGAAGQEAARFDQLLGLDEPSTVPRSTGGADERLQFLLGFLSVTTSVPDGQPCA